MTNTQNQPPKTENSKSESLKFLADAPELLRVRVLPAEFARLLGVSKQSVSRWISTGKVSINPLDGRLDVTTAVQQVLRNTDPGRLRSRVLRAAVADVADIRQRLAAADVDLAAARADADFFKKYADQADRTLGNFWQLISDVDLEVRAKLSAEEWHGLVDELFDEASADDAETSDDFDPADAAALDELLDGLAEPAAAPAPWRDRPLPKLGGGDEAADETAGSDG